MVVRYDDNQIKENIAIMKYLKPLKIKKFTKKEREQRVLMGLVELYIQTGQPIGSNTLKNAGFQDLSSATIRNYFAKMEKAGYLHQQHSSGGRIPTELAFQEYADKILETEDFLIEKQKLDVFQDLCSEATEEVANLIHRAADMLSEHSMCSVFISSARFDHDFIRDVKFLAIDNSRCLVVIVTDFGLLQTYTLRTEGLLKERSIKFISQFFQWRLGNGNKPSEMTHDDLVLSQEFYNEVMVRYMVNYSNFTHDDTYYTGLSKLLNYPEFGDAVNLAKGLAVFENRSEVENIISKTLKNNKISVWVGGDFKENEKSAAHCSVIAVPYYVNGIPVGVVAILGPMRMQYKKMFGLMHVFSENISEVLTKSLYKFKISFRTPNEENLFLEKEERVLLEGSKAILIENKIEERKEVNEHDKEKV